MVFDVEKKPETPVSGAATVVAPSYPPSLTNNETDGEKVDKISPAQDSENDSPYNASLQDEEIAGKEPTPSRRVSSLYPVQSHIQHPTSLLREAAFVAVLCMAQLFTQASLGQAIAPLHIIGASFGVANQPGQLSWFPAAYSLTVGTFILIAGRLGDLYGHKRFFVAGWIWYGVWSLLAGFAVYVRHSPVFFDVCRGMQGIGPAFLLPNALAILGRTYEQGRRKEMVFSIFGATAPSGFVFGAVFASLFAQMAWWPWAFWCMGIMCFAMGVAGCFAIPRSPPPVIDESDGYGMWERVDGWGCVTGVSALVLINFAWNQGPAVGWETPYTYALLIVGFVCLALFAWVEARASHPLLPMEALTKDTAFVLGCMAAGWSSFGIWVFYSWQFLEELRNTTPLLASAQFIPCAFSGLAAALTTGHILHRVGPSVVMMIAMTAFTTGLILIATAPVNQTYWAQIFISICIMPWGMDMSFPAATILLSDHMRKEHQGVAASLINTVINYSVSIGLGFAGTIESRVNKGGEDLLEGYRGAWYMGIGLAGLGICISVVFGGSQLRDRRMRMRGGRD
ncbi:major facilitator superfamily domain-containing protein [Cadophora sp. MPI-SDFR-AT-0126]|nr:major facilitator superfamily domain-containing protein [Leotiomycetes sp. MPI-SDFR-AT-0126]